MRSRKQTTAALRRPASPNWRRGSTRARAPAFWNVTVFQGLRRWDDALPIGGDYWGCCSLRLPLGLPQRQPLAFACQCRVRMSVVRTKRGQKPMGTRATTGPRYFLVILTL
jgi:hypothetical protein